MKHIITIIAALLIASTAMAEVSTPLFIGGGTSTIESNDESEGAASLSIGIQFEQYGQLEVERTEVDSDLVDSFDQTTARLVSRIVSIGPNSLTMQAGYTWASARAAGVTYTDSYPVLGLGYQLQIGKHLVVRYMHNKYLVDEFGDTVIDLDRPTENSISAIYAF